MRLSNYSSLASRLGWENMQAEVAIPALNKIVTNYINLIADCTGDVIDPDDAVAVLISWNPDSVFDLLVEDDFTTFGTSHLHELREDIEWGMRIGFAFMDALKGWWK